MPDRIQEEKWLSEGKKTEEDFDGPYCCMRNCYNKFFFDKYNIIKKEQHDIIQQQEQLKQDKINLEKELKHINDPDNLEKQARDQLRLIKPGETLYMFPDEITKQETSVDNEEDQDEE